MALNTQSTVKSCNGLDLVILSHILVHYSTFALQHFDNTQTLPARALPRHKPVQNSKQNPFPASLPRHPTLLFPLHFFPLMWYLQMCIKDLSSLGDAPIYKSLFVFSCPFPFI